MDLKTMSAAWRHLQQLSVEIGPRPSGSTANAQAADYIATTFRDAGLAVERQPYTVPAWEALETALWLDDASAAVVANVYAPSCDVSGPPLPLGTMAELETADLNGRIAILYGDLTREPLAAKAWPFKDEQAARLVDLLEAKRPLALITIPAKAGALARLAEDWEFEIPSATVPQAVGAQLLRKLPSTVRLRIDSRRTPGQASNVVARLPGARSDTIVLCAHFDTKVDTPGAADNGGGTAVLLALAQHFSQQSLPLTLEFVAFNNEEYLPLGDDEYLRRKGDRFGEIVAAINCDGVGPALGVNTVTAVTDDDAFTAQIRACGDAFPGVLWVDPWPESNHSTFAFRGVPSVALSNTAVMMHAHLRSDTIDWISRDKLGEAAALVAAIMEEVMGRHA